MIRGNDYFEIVDYIDTNHISKILQQIFKKMTIYYIIS